MKLKLILLIFIGIFFVFACKESSGRKRSIAGQAPQVIFDYCIFKSGSYWIYRDSVTGDLDTQTYSNGGGTLMNSQNENSLYLYYTTITSSYYKNLYEFLAEPKTLTDGDYLSYPPSTVCVMFNSNTAVKSEVKYGDTGFTRVVSFSDSLEIKGNKYHYVICIQNNIPGFFLNQKFTWWGKYSGIIKYTTKTGHTWELLKSEVHQ